MYQQPNRTSIARLVLVTLVVLLLGACSDMAARPHAGPDQPGGPPSSTARLTIVAPHNGQTISR